MVFLKSIEYFCFISYDRNHLYKFSSKFQSYWFYNELHEFCKTYRKLFISQFHKNHITSDNKLGATFQYSIILKHFIILWIHRMTKTNTFRSPKNGFVCLLPFVLFIPNITFKHTQFHTKCIVYRIRRGVDSYWFVTRCIGNMSSHLHRNIYCQ